jgi:adenine-specific DNA-methyltransferase
VKHGNVDHITREPEQVKAFRDTWRDGIHSYLTYLRDRLTVARDLLSESGSIFVQIGEENKHRIRGLLDELFSADNFVSEISFQKTAGQTDRLLPSVTDTILWYSKDIRACKFRKLQQKKGVGFEEIGQYYFGDFGGDRRPLTREEIEAGNREGFYRPFRISDITSNKPYGLGKIDFEFEGRRFIPPGSRYWTHSPNGRLRLALSNRLYIAGNSVRFVGFLEDDPVVQVNNQWNDTGISGFSSDKVYVVQTSPKVVERCLQMATDPGDLVLDPTCGSGTTAYVAEQWGRRWIAIDTSRVALALARARIMGARYAYYLLADSKDGQQKEAEVTKSVPSEAPTHGNIRQGFVYERVPHITLKSIANNSEIDVIWEKFQQKLEPLREQINVSLKMKWEEWEIPREASDKWPDPAKKLHAEWWQQRIARQKEIDASIAAKADFEYLYDKPYDDKRKVRVAGPFSVESLSPHRVLAVDENDELIDSTSKSKNGDEQGFVQMILENLKTAGVQQAHKEDKIAFSSITPWPGYWVCAEGRYTEGTAGDGTEKRAAIFIGPEFGTVSRPDLVEAAREAGDAGFDILIACAFNYDARSTEFDKLGRIPVLKARMNADLHMADDLKNTGKGNLFVIFGEPDIDILNAADEQIQVKVKGVDVFHPNTGEVRSDGVDGIACWFIDTDYNEESFFVRHAYFLGANDPYKSLKTTLKAEVNEEAWATLNSDTSRPFDKPKSGRIAVKVINHLGDEVMKVFRIG